LPFASRQATVSAVKGVQACRLPALKPLKCLQRSAAASTMTRHSSYCPLLLRARSLPFASLQATALCWERRSTCRLPTLKPSLSLGQHHPAEKICRHGPRANAAAYAFERAAAFSFAAYFLRAFLSGTCQFLLLEVYELLPKTLFGLLASIASTYFQQTPKIKESPVLHCAKCKWHPTGYAPCL